MYKPDLALNNPQGLIYHEAQPTDQTAIRQYNLILI